MTIQLSGGAERAILDAVALATASGRALAEPIHLLPSLAGQAAALLRSIGADPEALRAAALRRVEALPPGPGGAAGRDARLARSGVLVTTIAAQHARELGDPRIESAHLLIGLFEADNICRFLLGQEGADTRRLREGIARAQAATLVPGPAPAAAPVPAPEPLPPHLTDLAEGAGPAFGRDEELRRLISVLNRRDRANPLLVGEAGIGKRAMLNALATLVAPARMAALDPKVLGGTGPAARERLDELPGLLRGGILVLDNLSSADADGPAAVALAALLEHGGFRVVATMTPGSHTAWLRRHPDLMRRFRLLQVSDLSADSVLAVLRAMRPRYEEHHRLEIGDDALVAAAALSARHLPGAQPEKALDLLDEAAAQLRMDTTMLPAAAERPHAPDAYLDLLTDAVAGNAAHLATLHDALQRHRARPPATTELTAGDVAGVLVDLAGLPAPAGPVPVREENLWPGDPRQLGRYRIVRRLGEGGQGVVYLGEAPAGGLVAIKMLHAEVTRNPAAHERFEREVAAAQRVASFCTAQVLESGVEGRRPYVVSEFVDGPSLRESIEEGGTRAGAALDRLAIGTITALAAIAEAGIVHRDFKPDNVLLAPDGLRVIDFGIARALDTSASVTGQIIGTPAYMAPEQFRGGNVGPAADVFAWACTLVYAAIGRPPHGSGPIPEIMYNKVNGVQDLGDFHRLASPALAALVEAALRLDPAGRPSPRRILLSLLGRPDQGAAGLLAEGAAVATRRLDE
ncbi:protein kinase domain-containing protein [Actinomadura parmotrematis]|uniref:Protein kinase n=1 Tax=Actinomadura parmotrematis TaxID=2864039 RepID=A0ABS7FNP0_9ACTN|nr:protein kinase [Actinomadura parmotrematis]MBW8481993.1 protein kinase [Actinomadura parmotrematis]